MGYEENEQFARMIKNYELWHPAFFERSVDYVMTGPHSILVDLEDNSKIEYNDYDNTIRDVSHIYGRDFNSALEETTWRKEFGHQLRRAIIDRGITQEDLSDLSGVSRQMLSRYIHGLSTPSGYVLSRLSEILECDVRKLTTFELEC